MTKEQTQFLARRFRIASQRQPELVDLKSLLLTIGGKFVVAPMQRDPDIPQLLRSGFIMHGSVTLKIMARNTCHQNMASLWVSQKAEIIGIGTGYALSRDNLWRQHSWGISRQGTIIETTQKRVKYFGILLQGRHAQRFVSFNP